MIGWTYFDRCPVCKSRDRHFYVALHFDKEQSASIADLIQLDEDGGVMLKFLICKCGLVFVDRYLSDQEAYYRDVYTKLHTKTVGLEGIVDNEKQRAERIAGGWLDALYDSTVLDIGCGHGEFLKAVEVKGYEGYGVDPRPEFADFHRVWASLDDIPEGQQFSAITMIHMLEHLVDPIEYLEGLKKFLKPGGLLFIEVPSFGPADGIVGFSHPIAYTSITLDDVLRKSGWKVESIKTMVVGTDVAGQVKFVLQAIGR
jgi:SAM-dependent methyltransferase